MHTYNDSNAREKRKSLRNNATEVEKRLWFRLKSSQLGYKFRRQQGIGPYVVDFYCPKKHLAIELDGSQHNDKENQEYDQFRTKYLNSLNITVLRFWNTEISKSLNTVVGIIWDKLHEQ